MLQKLVDVDQVLVDIVAPSCYNGRMMTKPCYRTYDAFSEADKKNKKIIELLEKARKQILMSKAMMPDHWLDREGLHAAFARTQTQSPINLVLELEDMITELKGDRQKK